ncbi:hypothetical protein [Mycoplasma sp. 1012]
MTLKWFKNGDENDFEKHEGGVTSRDIKWLQEKKVIPYNFEDFNQQHMDNFINLFTEYDSGDKMFRIIKPVKDEAHTVGIMIIKHKTHELYYCEEDVVNLWNYLLGEFNNVMKTITDEKLKERLIPFHEKIKEERITWMKRMGLWK